jgi:predicted TIM-barrel fold metal-dependent hydrolase
MVRGEAVIRDTMADIEALDLPREQLELIFHGNAERVLGLDAR